MPIYSNWLLGVLNGAYSTDWDTDTIKVALFAQGASSYVTNSTGITYWNQIASGEITGTGYTASGAIASGCYIDFNGHNPTKIRLNAVDTSWTSSTLTARYAVVYKWTGNANTSPVICWLDFGSNQSSSSGTFQIGWNTNGIMEITVPNT